MNRYFSKSVIAILIIATVFVFGAFINAVPASAQTTSLCQMVEMFITTGVISPDKAAAAKAASGCSVSTPLIPIISTSSVPVAKILSSKDLAIRYDYTGKESQLVTSYLVSISAYGNDAYVPLNPFVVGLISKTGSNNTVRSAKTVTTPVLPLPITKDSDGKEFYTISAGNTVNFSVAFSVNPGELFAGSYYARLYGTWMPKYGKSLEVNPVLNSTNAVTIIGETSPYISSATFVPGITKGYDGVKVTGARLNGPQLAAIKCDNIGGISNKPYSLDSTSASYIAIDTMPSGAFCTIQITDSNTGASNTFGFSVTGTTPPTLPKAVSMDISDAKTSYAPGQAIRYSVRTLTTDDRIGMPEQGFNVQAQIQDAYTKDTVQVGGVYQSVNGTYNPATFYWDIEMKAPSDTSKTYIADSSFYCSRPNQNLCADGQINKDFTFNIVSTTTIPVYPKPTVTFLWQIKGSAASFAKSPALIPVGSDLLVRWESTNATNCTASASPSVSTWIGSKGTWGMISVGKADVGRSYKLSCTGAGGTSASTIDVYPNGAVPPEVSTTTQTVPVATTSPVVTPSPTPTPVVTPTTPTLASSEIWCNKGGWVGKNSVLGMWSYPGLVYNPDARFLCHTDKNIYRCASATQEASSGVTYWNTFSIKINNGAPTPNYTCDTTQGKWISNKGASTVTPNYATALVSWESFVKLLEILR